MVTTRTADLADAADVARLWTMANVARRPEAGVALGPVAGADTAAAEQKVRSRLADPAAFTVLAADGGDLVAMAMVLQAIEQDGAGTQPLPGLAHVAMVAVRPDRWGQGLGTVVLDAAIRDGRGRGYTQAQLWTHETNRRAQRLYERLGWVASGRVKIDDCGEVIRHYLRDL